MTCRPIAPTLAFALVVLAVPAWAQSTPVEGASAEPAPVQTRRLPAEPPTTAATLPGTRQTGSASFDHAGTPVTVRSWEPEGGAAQGYRINFEALDVDGDGFLSRGEAASHPNLAREFGGVDANADGRASRAELAGWTITD